jgi:hypothetical protein
MAIAGLSLIQAEEVERNGNTVLKVSYVIGI